MWKMKEQKGRVWGLMWSGNLWYSLCIITLSRRKRDPHIVCMNLEQVSATIVGSFWDKSFVISFDGWHTSYVLHSQNEIMEFKLDWKWPEMDAFGWGAILVGAVCFQIRPPSLQELVVTLSELKTWQWSCLGLTPPHPRVAEQTS